MTRTSATTMMVGMIGAILLAATGCTVTSKHTLDSNDTLDLFAGECTLVASGHIPGGAVTSYSIYDAYSDALDVGVVDYAYGCAPLSGYAVSTSYGSVSNSETIPVSSDYNLAVVCQNVISDCVFTVDNWSYD